MTVTDQAILNVFGLTLPWQAQDPFLFCMHHDDAYPRGNEQLGPAVSLAGRDLGQDFAGKDGFRMYHGDVVPGFPQHPHRGFETVTIVTRGLVDHADSLGATARYGHGDVQWLTAGQGIVHAEMFPLVERDRDNPLELFQLWLNLPRTDKRVPPHFAMLWAETIPTHVARDAGGRACRVTVVAGALGEARPPAPPPHSWAARAEAHVAIWRIAMEPGAEWTLPAAAAGTNRSLYFFRGASLRIAERKLPPSSGVELAPEAAMPLVNDGDTEAEMLLLGGRPINEPVAAYGPFVMNDRAELQQAFLDYQHTHFGGWPWPSDDPVHPADAGRFARRPDGRTERPTPSAK